jgi:hypothetical protein
VRDATFAGRSAAGSACGRTGDENGDDSAG